MLKTSPVLITVLNLAKFVAPGSPVGQKIVFAGALPVQFLSTYPLPKVDRPRKSVHNFCITYTSTKRKHRLHNLSSKM